MFPIATVADVYGSTGGPTLQSGFLDGPANENLTTTQATTGAGALAAAVQPVQIFPWLRISPLVGGAIVVGVLAGAKLLREHGRAEGDFKEARITLWFVVAVVLANAAGTPLLKAASAKYPISGVNSWIQNA